MKNMKRSILTGIAVLMVPTMAMAFNLGKIVDQVVNKPDEKPAVEQPAPTRKRESSIQPKAAPVDDRPTLATKDLITKRGFKNEFQGDVHIVGGGALDYASVYTGKNLAITQENNTLIIHGNCTKAGMTDQDGFFNISIPDGTYDVVIWKTGYQAIIHHVRVPGYIAETLYVHGGGPANIRFDE